MPNSPKGSRRVADALDIVAQARPAASSRQIIKRVGAPRSSGYDLISCLVERQFLQRRTVGHWVLGAEIHALAMSRFGLGYIASEIASALTALQDATQETAQLVVLNQTRLLVTHVSSNLPSIPLRAEIGAEIPVNWTAAGLLLVSGMNQPALRRFIRVNARPLPGSYAAPDCEQWVREALDAKQRGYAVVTGRANQDIGSIAAPVSNQHGKCVAAVSLILPVTRLLNCRDSLVSLVQTTATKLSRGLTSGKSQFVSLGGQNIAS